MKLLSGNALLAIAVTAEIGRKQGPCRVQSKILTRIFGLPARHLESILQPLSKQGIIVGTRGPRGGYRLARDPRDISIADIVRVVERERVDEIVGHLPDRIVPVLQEVESRLWKAFPRISVYSIMTGGDGE